MGLFDELFGQQKQDPKLTALFTSSEQAFRSTKDHPAAADVLAPEQTHKDRPSLKPNREQAQSQLTAAVQPCDRATAKLPVAKRKRQSGPAATPGAANGTQVPEPNSGLQSQAPSKKVKVVKSLPAIHSQLAAPGLKVMSQSGMILNVSSLHCIPSLVAAAPSA